MRRLPTSPRAGGGGGISIPGEALQAVKAKQLIALILHYLIPLNGEVTECGRTILWKSRMGSLVCL